jgi:NMD protein affecting ribosome stability and mRNA decay
LPGKLKLNLENWKTEMKITTMTVKECASIHGEQEFELSNAVYIIRDNERVKYIGKTSRSVPQRIREHLHNRASFHRCSVEMRIYQFKEADLGETEKELIVALSPDENLVRPMICSKCGKKVKELISFSGFHSLCGKCARMIHTEQERKQGIKYWSTR